MRLDPEIYSAAAVDQWDRSQRRYARLGVVGLAWLLLVVVVGHLLHLVVIAIAIIVVGFAVIVAMSVAAESGAATPGWTPHSQRSARDRVYRLAAD